MSVNLREDFINEAEGGHTPLTPNIIARDGMQVMTDGRPGGPEDKVLSGPNAAGSGPIINPQQPTVVPPVVAPPAPLDDLS
jgi:hypothetical protein